MAAASDVHDSFGNCRDHKGKRTRTGAPGSLAALPALIGFFARSTA
jgi:hypothetical protein